MGGSSLLARSGGTRAGALSSSAVAKSSPLKRSGGASVSSLSSVGSPAGLTKTSPLKRSGSGLGKSRGSGSGQVPKHARHQATPRGGNTTGGTSPEKPTAPKLGKPPFAVKYASKTPQEIVGPLGLQEVQTSLQEVLDAMQQAPFDSALLAQDFLLYKERCAEFKKVLAVAQKKIVSLDIKISKWKEVPDGVTALVKLWRNKVPNAKNSKKSNKLNLASCIPSKPQDEF